MTKRELAITNMRIAGYHDDQRERARLLIESRVNRQTINKAWDEGVRAKQNGVKCSCFFCARS